MKYHFDAVIFDLDGVITKTALVHSRAWKKMFDGFLAHHAEKTSTGFSEFDHEKDYLPYVDGKPRYKGVQSFLESRNINLPYGDPDDHPELETVCGLGNRKNEAFNDVLDKEGVEVYQSTVELIKKLKDKGLRVGVASSSKNCKAVLEAARISDLFDQVVDGEVAERLRLPGKPRPDTFLAAAERLGVVRERAVVVEDAISGVRAGRAGGFGLVIGVDRKGDPESLRQGGADIVVRDLSELV